MPDPDSTSGAEQRQQSDRRARDRGGRRKSDWPDDAGLTACPTCGHDRLQSQGALDTGEYVWTCLGCGREFQTGRASRMML
jgi:hypothetical protein